MSSSTSEDPVFRIDQFFVPHHSRQEFLKRVSATHSLLRQQTGFVRDIVLEQEAGPDEVRIITIAEWQDQGTVNAVSSIIAQVQKAEGFDRQAFIAKLGIRADIGTYRMVSI